MRKTREYAASVIKQIMTEYRPGVIENYEMPTLYNLETARVTGFLSF